MRAWSFSVAMIVLVACGASGGARTSTTGGSSRPPVVVDPVRISGDAQIRALDSVNADMLQSCKGRLYVPVKLCIDERGVPFSVTLHKTSGYRTYDAQVGTALYGWR